MQDRRTGTKRRGGLGGFETDSGALSYLDTSLQAVNELLLGIQMLVLHRELVLELLHFCSEL